MEPCEGFAPTYSHCVRQFVVKGDFSFYQAWGFEYSGLWYMRGQTETYTVETYCEKAYGQPPQCVDTYAGLLFAGQTMTVVALAPGFGYWKLAI